jgi:hypothetical protein
LIVTVTVGTFGQWAFSNARLQSRRAAIDIVGLNAETAGETVILIEDLGGSALYRICDGTQAR